MQKSAEAVFQYFVWFCFLPEDTLWSLSETIAFNYSDYLKLTPILRIWLSASQRELDDRAWLIAKGAIAELVKQYLSTESLSEILLAIQLECVLQQKQTVHGWSAWYQCHWGMGERDANTPYLAILQN